jgi:small subunit ribosomal protein S33
MLEYYPPTLKLKGLGERIWGQEGVERGLILMDPRERQRLEDVERRKKMGKGPPKKGKWKERERSGWCLAGAAGALLAL